MSKKKGYVPDYTENQMIEMLDKLRRTQWWKKKLNKE